jgi:hypothetical protein
MGEWRYFYCILYLGPRWEWLALYPRSFYKGAKNRCPWGMRPRVCLGAVEKKKKVSVRAGNRVTTSKVTTLTELSQNTCNQNIFKIWSTSSEHIALWSPYLGAFAKLRKAILSFVTSVCLSVLRRETTRLPLCRFSWNLIFEYFSKNGLENASSITTW